MNFAKLITERRHLLGLTQSALARESGVSLPHIQRIEAQSANPSVETLQRILKVLGEGLGHSREQANWDILIQLGLPLTAKESVRVRKTEAELIRNLRLACLDLSANDRSNRYRGSFEALLLALRDHYPALYKNAIGKAPLFAQFLPRKITGSHIKLKRIALSKLGAYL